MKKLLTSICLVWIVCSMSAQYMPETVPNPRTIDAMAFVANPDKILSATEVETITDLALSLNKVTGVELVTVIVGNIGEIPAFDFAYDLFNKWGIGDKEKNRGVLILFALESRDIQIITGGGVEGVLPDATCSDIVYNTIIPICKEGMYAEGLIAGNKAIYDALMTDAAKAELLLDWKAKPVSESPWSFLSLISLIIVIITTIRHYMQPKCPQCGKRGSKEERQIVEAATFEKSGTGIVTYTCLCCSHKWKKNYTIPKMENYSTNSHSSGGSTYGGTYSSGRSYGGGSFGGGRSFGGGAGGKF